MFVQDVMTPKPLTVNGDSHVKPAVAPPAHRHWRGPVVGGFYLTMGGVHLGLVAADAETYRHFADHPLTRRRRPAGDLR